MIEILVQMIDMPYPMEGIRRINLLSEYVVLDRKLDTPYPMEVDTPYQGLEVGLIGHIQGIGYGVLEFLGVWTKFDIFQNINILYLQYGVLISSGYDVLIFFPLWSLVSAGMNTPYLP
ncbi:hypothetical protein Tco_1267434 [Tanacetum coccineum]